MPRRLATLGLLSLAWTASASAGEFFHRLAHEERPHPTPDPGRPRHFCHSHERAGWPLSLRTHLEPTNAGDSIGYYVGGSGGHGSGPRCRNEGTYGWDYSGLHFPRRVALGFRGRKVQEGPEGYRTDPPFEVPNVFEAEVFKGHRAGGE